MKSLNHYISHIYDEDAHNVRVHQILITREDGVMIFSNRTKSDSQAALVAGVWQAVSELTKLSRINNSHRSPSHFLSSQFRLSFELSDQGVFVLCFNFHNNQYFASLVYDDVLNPALLKKQFRDFVKIISEKLLKFESEIFKAPTKNNERKYQSKQSRFLFDDLSDAEVDKIFSDLRGEHVIC